MPDRRPIGVFDSGVGGLTVLHAIQDRLPDESTIYVGDLARCPYGRRPQREVRRYAFEIADYLAAQGVKLLVVACNTATAAAYFELRDRYPFPVVGVISPGAAEAARRSRGGAIGVVATDGTVASGAYTAAIRACRPSARVVERAASWLVPLIESGEAADASIVSRLRPLLGGMMAERVDTVVLGCTHFPLVQHLFREAIGGDILMLDSASTTSREVARLLEEFELSSDTSATHRILVTGPSAPFAVRAQAMFRASPPIEPVDLRAGTGIW